MAEMGEPPPEIMCLLFRSIFNGMPIKLKGLRMPQEQQQFDIIDSLLFISKKNVGEVYTAMFEKAYVSVSYPSDVNMVIKAGKDRIYNLDYLIAIRLSSDFHYHIS